jgi:hypothetical protein
MFKNLTNEWQQFKQHLQQEAKHLTGALSPESDFILLSIYSKMSLMSQVTATMNDPKQREPKLYLIVHQNPVAKLKLP